MPAELFGMLDGVPAENFGGAPDYTLSSLRGFPSRRLLKKLEGDPGRGRAPVPQDVRPKGIDRRSVKPPLLYAAEEIAPDGLHLFVRDAQSFHRCNSLTADFGGLVHFVPSKVEVEIEPAWQQRRPCIALLPRRRRPPRNRASRRL